MSRKRTLAIGSALAAAVASTVLGAPAAVAAPATLVIGNPAPISPPDATATGTSSALVVGGQTGLVTDVDVTLNAISSTFPDDLDILLVGPTGKSVMLMSDVCGNDPNLTNTTLRFDDEATVRLADEGPCASGSFFPYSSGDSEVAPFVPNAPALSAYDGLSPNGTWTLLVADDTDEDLTTIAGGFTLTFQLSDVVAPTVTFGKVPKPSTKTTLKVPFTVDDAGSTFECNVDGVGWNPCTSPAKLKRLSVGKHKLSVRATDPSGNRGPEAKATVKVLPKR